MAEVKSDDEAEPTPFPFHTSLAHSSYRISRDEYVNIQTFAIRSKFLPIEFDGLNPFPGWENATENDALTNLGLSGKYEKVAPNVGIRCGKSSKVVALVVKEEGISKLSTYLEGLKEKMPRTYTQSLEGVERHYFFNNTGRTTELTSTIKSSEDWDSHSNHLLTDGCTLILAGSVHPVTGKKVTLLPGSKDENGRVILADMPKSIFDWCKMLIGLCDKIRSSRKEPTPNPPVTESKRRPWAKAGSKESKEEEVKGTITLGTQENKVSVSGPEMKDESVAGLVPEKKREEVIKPAPVQDDNPLQKPDQGSPEVKDEKPKKRYLIIVLSREEKLKKLYGWLNDFLANDYAKLLTPEGTLLKNKLYKLYKKRFLESAEEFFSEIDFWTFFRNCIGIKKQGKKRIRLRKMGADGKLVEYIQVPPVEQARLNLNSFLNRVV